MSEDDDESDEVRLDWPMTASREVSEKYLEGDMPEIDESELDV